MNLKKFTENLMQDLIDGKASKFDSMDTDPTPIDSDSDQEVYTFKTYEWVDAPSKSNWRLAHHSTVPIGQIVYTITITGKFVKFDEDE